MNSLNDEQLNRLYDRIEQLEKENEALKKGNRAHWISVKGRLPEDDGEVLACNGNDVFIAHCEGDYWAVYLLNTEDDCYEQHVVKVTHWMPLPEPPEVKK